MNAPEGLITAQFENLPLTAICPSETPAQVRRRKRYSAPEITELAQNIKACGVIQPVVVRKLTALRDLAAYELVAGERRWLASREAGLAHVPALVREIADADLLVFQLSENLKRASLDPLEEAEGFRDLMSDAAARGSKLKAEDVAEIFGISRAHVYNRLKLLQASAPVLEALAAGRIDHTKTLIIARIPVAKLQKKALEIAEEKDGRGNQIAHRELADRLRDKLMVRLDKVPFSIEDASFSNDGRTRFDSQVTHRHRDSVVQVPAIPACVACHNCSATDPGFAAEIEEAYGKGAVVCTERPCHDFKVKVHFERRVNIARDAGLPIIEDPNSYDLRDKYVDLDDPCYEAPMKDDAHPTHRDLLGDKAVVHAIFINPRNNQPRDLMKRDEAGRHLKKLGIKIGTPEPVATTDAWPFKGEPASSQSAEERVAERDAEREAARKQAEREELERLFRRKLLAEIHAKWKGPLKREELQAVADRLMDGGEWAQVVDDLYGGQIDTARLKEPELARLLFELTVGLCVDYLGDSPNLLIAAAKRFRIDPAKVRRQAKAELGGEPEPEEKAAPKKKAKKK